MKDLFKILGAAAIIAVSSAGVAYAQQPLSQQTVAPKAADSQIEWLTINLETAGSLGVEVLYNVNTLADVKDLRVTGPLNSDDWTTLKNMTAIRNLDLSGASTTAVPAATFKSRASLISIILPETLKTIGAEAFYQAGLKEINVPASVYSIGKQCFYHCDSLRTATLLGKANIPDYCFYCCKKLQKVVLSEGLSSIGNYAFRDCTELSEINLPETVTSIGDGVFYETTGLRELAFPEALQTIGYEAFRGTGLIKAVLPDQLTSLGERAFIYCSSLEELTLPGTLHTLTYNIFVNDSKIKTIYCKATTPPVIQSTSSDPFSGLTKSGVKLIVPTFSIVNYKLDTYWKNFGTIEGGVTSDNWTVNGVLSLTNNRRMEGTPSVSIAMGGSLTVGGTAAMPVNNLSVAQDLYNKVYGQLINSCPVMTANSASLSFYTNSNNWYFITMPCDVRLADVTHSANCDFVFRYYDGASRAANGTGSSWKNVAADGVLEAGKAYIYQCNKAGTITMPLEAAAIARLLEAGDRQTAVTAHAATNEANAGWNLIGNPYLSYYDMAATSLTCPVTLWDGSKYVAYSLIDDDVVLFPTQAVFIQQPDADGTVTFGAEGRQLTAEVARAQNVAAAQTSERQLYNFTLTSADGVADRTRVVINDEASLAYESSRDASKFFAPDADVAALYTVDADGNRLAINERPEADGTVRMGVFTPAAGEWRLGIAGFSGEVILRDNVAGKEFRFTQNSEYTFVTDAAGYDDSRFTLMIKPGETGVDAASADCMAGAVVMAGIGEVTVTGAEGKAVKVYTPDGRLAAARVCASASETMALPAGLYVVNAGETTVKCIVK